MKKVSLFMMAISLAFVSCNKDDDDDNNQNTDTIKPVVTVMSPSGHSEFAPGDTIHFEGEAVDDKALSEMKVDIHWAGDGHGHGGKRASVAEKWDEEFIFELSGREYHVHEHLTIPANADTGMHHLIVTALDKAGNQSEFVEVDFHVEK
ncbi:DUF4625 domain-containing protein [Salibacter halophilus]|uniref:DUF4625 domain-containing protein n=1 Tax=Salibacter halophilus TaxID=1803916 RepID=A0A6N6MB56_9FLAO|nr:DUF4625 domain-containing protein [Salibacter halophilus]KAB1065661.1 DUF4625 domain-containing protein [Salibacter halophilus]